MDGWILINCNHQKIANNLILINLQFIQVKFRCKIIYNEAPEMILLRETPEQEADYYSLGMILYEMMIG